MLNNPAQQKVQVLHLEDDENDRTFVREMVRADGLDCEFVAVQTQQDFETELQNHHYNIIISDYSMPSFNGLSGLAIARKLAPRIPFIFFSGTIGEESAVESLKNGAVDYIIKNRPHRLVPAIRRALRNTEEQTLLRQAEQKNREQAELLDKATDAILVCDLSNHIVYWNRSAERIYGWTVAEATGKDAAEILFHGKSPAQFHEMSKSVNAQGEWTGEFQQLTKDGKSLVVQSRVTLIRDKDGNSKSLLIINTDITERKQLEEQFLRSQRLESLGVLVSGIAHDLNNALTPILIGVDILRRSPEKENIIETIERSAKRGADMVKQVLAFARGGDSQKVAVQMESLVKEMGKVIADTFPRNIQCEVKIDSGLKQISGIPTQLYQVLLNLCVNARDAMPDGGTLVLTTENVSVNNEIAARHADAKPGNYIYVSVADTGTGIPPEQIEKIFQPFFTTKDPGKGTGLGLSTSLNIIKSHSGFLVVNSTVGRGTEFKFYLPVIGDTSSNTPANETLPMGNGENILVVDDEAIVLVIARTALENYGYRVHTASNGLEAITCLNERRDAIDLVITDIGMPLMGGVATAAALRRIKSGLKIIAASVPEREADAVKDGIKMDAFLPKPFTVKKLLTTVHWVFAQKGEIK